MAFCQTPKLIRSVVWLVMFVIQSNEWFAQILGKFLEHVAVCCNFRGVMHEFYSTHLICCHLLLDFCNKERMSNTEFCGVIIDVLVRHRLGHIPLYFKVIACTEGERNSGAKFDGGKFCSPIQKVSFICRADGDHNE